jgi:protein gp37
MAYSKIEWTETTWNPTTGCSKISAGCLNCYAEKMAKRLQLMGVNKYKNGFKLSLHPEVVQDPYSWKTPRTVFVNSMSDLFHEDIPLGYIQDVFKSMIDNPRHTYQILTKRAENLLQLDRNLPWSKNIWMGVTVENRDSLFRIDHLRQSRAFVKFLSIEPLLEDLGQLDLNGIDWVIVGGESGPKARPMEEEWVIKIKNSCHDQNVPFFFKQWGGTKKKKTGRLLEGKFWDNMPAKTYL